MIKNTFESKLISDNYSSWGILNMYNNLYTYLFYLCILTSSFCIQSAENISQKIFKFGVVPQSNATKIVKLWGPLLQHISTVAGVKIEIVTAHDIPEFENNLANKAYDFAYMNPYHFVVFHQRSGYQALLHQKDKKLRGIIVTHKSSGITTLQQLQGERIAFPSPAAFAASMITRGTLTEEKIKFTPVYVSSHDSVYKAVAKEFFKAGGGVVRTFNSIDEKTKSKLTILWKSPGFTPHAIAALDDVDQKVRLKIQQAFSNLHNTPKGIALLKELNMASGFIKATNSDWDDVKSLKLEQL